MINERFERLLGSPARKPEAAIDRHYSDIAACIQSVMDESMLRLTCSLAASTQMKNLCVAGGVALNYVSNVKVLRAGHFSKV